jgi:seryl-tRNA synthetase
MVKVRRIDQQVPSEEEIIYKINDIGVESSLSQRINDVPGEFELADEFIRIAKEIKSNEKKIVEASRKQKYSIRRIGTAVPQGECQYNFEELQDAERILKLAKGLDTIEDDIINSIVNIKTYVR